MELKEIKKDVYACLQKDKGFGWNNAGFVNLGGGLAIDTFIDLNLTRQMIQLYKTVTDKPIRRLVNTHHNCDHVWGNQLFKNSEIIAHQLCAKEMEKEKRMNMPAVFENFKQMPDKLSSQINQFVESLNEFEYSDIEITLPNHLLEESLELELDGYPCQLIYVGPAHTVGDLIVYLPEHKVIFAGDIVFSHCTPVGWEGTHAKWIEALDLLVSLNPEIIVPGHGPLCDIDMVKELRTYFEYVYSEARRFFDDGLDPLEASKKIDISSYIKWTGPEKLYFSVYRAYREFRNDVSLNTPINALALFRKCNELWIYWKENGLI
ncbi:MAG: MBL fold metallo-hydrolase [Promethearchaeota archaeon]